ncbi:hypothetical protein [Pseudomonas kitaguniensis]|uniref:hypothetical protein n=1 Tax=Pseudomonas kitaguniensis TaxID=2607908 RepID=UPI003CFD69E4
MTLAVIWYRENFGQLWCAADTRISGDARVLTDSGPKIFPVPVVCHESLSSTKWRVCKRYSFGFAYAGSTLAAMSTHAIASACTQNFAQKMGLNKPISVESVANLYADIGTRQIIEMSSRQGALEFQSQSFFDAFIFGFCPSENRFVAFVIVSSTAGGAFHFNIARVVLGDRNYLPIGSGESEFVSLMTELKGNKDAGVITTLREMVKRETRKDVGGHLQIGVTTKKGFNVVPVLDTSNGPGEAFVSFLGWDATSYKGLDGYTIGYSAIKP